MSRFTLTRRGGLGTRERAMRILAGFALAIFAVASLHSLHDFGGFTVSVSLVAALLGIGLTATGAGGYCPLYARLGFGRLRAKGGLWYGKE